MPSLLCLSVNTASDLSRLITATCLPIIRLHRCAQRMMRLLVVTSVSWSPCVSLCLLVTTVSSAKDVNRLRCHLGWDQGTQISPGKRQFWENCPAYCIHREYQACGWYSQSYSVDGSSDVAFCCQWCSNLVFLLTPSVLVMASRQCLCLEVLTNYSSLVQCSCGDLLSVSCIEHSHYSSHSTAGFNTWWRRFAEFQCMQHITDFVDDMLTT